MRRYVIHRDNSVAWTLVYEGESGKWHVEKLGPDKERSRLSINEFETSESGQRLSHHLRAALFDAEMDA